MNAEDEICGYTPQMKCSFFKLPRMCNKATAEVWRNRHLLRVSWWTKCEDDWDSLEKSGTLYAHWELWKKVCQKPSACQRDLFEMRGEVESWVKLY